MPTYPSHTVLQIKYNPFGRIFKAQRWHGIFWGLIFGPGIFLGFDFFSHLIIPFNLEYPPTRAHPTKSWQSKCVPYINTSLRPLTHDPPHLQKFSKTSYKLIPLLTGKFSVLWVHFAITEIIHKSQTEGIFLFNHVPPFWDIPTPWAFWVIWIFSESIQFHIINYKNWHDKLFCAINENLTHK